MSIGSNDRQAGECRNVIFNECPGSVVCMARMVRLVEMMRRGFNARALCDSMNE